MSEICSPVDLSCPSRRYPEIIGDKSAETLTQ